MFALLLSLLLVPNVVCMPHEMIQTDVSTTSKPNTTTSKPTPVPTISRASAVISCDYNDDCNHGICQTVVRRSGTTKECSCDHGWLSVNGRCNYQQKDRLTAIIASSPFGGGWFGVGMYYVSCNNSAFIVGGLIIACCNVFGLATLFSRSTSESDKTCASMFLGIGVLGVFAVWIMIINGSLNDGRDQPLA